MLSTVVLHTRLSERQLEIDRLEREVVSAHGVFDVLRQQHAELRAPTRLASESSRLGMHPAPASDFLPVDPWALARVLATRGTIDPNDGTLNRERSSSTRCDAYALRPTAWSSSRGATALARTQPGGTTARGRRPIAPSRRPVTVRGDRSRVTRPGPSCARRNGSPDRRAAPHAPTTRCCRRCVTVRSATASRRSVRRAPARRLREERRRTSPPRKPPDRRRRVRRTITTTKPPLAQRFGAGRPRRRLIATLVGILVVLAIVLARVALLQGSSGDDLRSVGAEQWGRTRVLPAQRGAIFDRNGDELALSVPAATVVVNPLQITDPAGTASVLAQLLDLDAEHQAALAAAITSDAAQHIGFRYVARQIDPADRPPDRRAPHDGREHLLRGPSDVAGRLDRPERHRAHRRRWRRNRRSRAAVQRPAPGLAGPGDAGGRPGRPLDRRQRADDRRPAAGRRHHHHHRPLGAVLRRAGAAATASTRPAPRAASSW